MAELRRFLICVCVRMCVRVAVRGIPLYSRNTARRHVCVYVCVYTKVSNQGDFAYIIT